ncbi:phage tail protein [Labilibaculum manganireducens]|uniref:Phage tail collar domain-containing protein n=1 Tax=Labilibaculum manganireducens TaxID=1940525 RepID=A0A2N3HVL4_9BACT|nr:tail fiber protein [Labilibaculum manganireducens]PKQ62115.1 hypothetical protein BZG01_17955 [Labilibaculum manganireducens]
MDDGYLGEIRLFAGNFAPRGWHYCDGSLLPIADNDALFSLLGTVYGGDGRSTFGLPDFRGRIPVGVGTGPGLTERWLGQISGMEISTLTVDSLPSHTHSLKAVGTEGNEQQPEDAVFALSYGQFQQEGSTYTGQNTNFTKSTTNLEPMNPKSVGNAGGSTQHYNVQPFLGINYVICLQGLYPSRNT